MLTPQAKHPPSARPPGTATTLGTAPARHRAPHEMGHPDFEGDPKHPHPCSMPGACRAAAAVPRHGVVKSPGTGWSRHKAPGPSRQLCSPSKGTGTEQDATPKKHMLDAEQDATYKSPFAGPYFTLKLLTGGCDPYQWPPDCPDPTAPHGALHSSPSRFAAVVSLAGRVSLAAAIRAAISAG